MNDNNISQLHKPEPTDLLQQVLKKGAQQLLAQAIEAEVQQLLADHKGLLTEDGKTGLVRNGYLPERTIQTGLGDIDVKVPKVRDRTDNGIKFNSSLVPPYLKRSQSVEEFLPWLYLRGISTGDFSESLKHLLGEEAKGLSAATISRLKASWEADFTQWQKRDLTKKRYVYVWADGVYCNVRMGDKVCLLVIIGSDELGNKELIAVSDGYRESEESWSEVLLGLKQRGLSTEPKVAIGDGALGFWKALARCWPTTQGQRCWVHKTANVLAKLPKSMQPKVKSALHEIWQSETKEQANKNLDNCIELFEAKYPKAMKCLVKDREALLVFYDFPAEHWGHLRTSNPIESVFATVRLRTTKSKNCGSRATTLAMVLKLMETAQKRWHRLRGYNLLADVITGVKFRDGIKLEQQGQDAA
jgi:putative transposase|tara:strand:- start:323 stop:1567 length:1245 start_codon:yes stop_codon:yes gene_type:complete